MFGKSVKLQCVTDILARHEGGVYKRIDENRELLELLQREAPELLAKRPWITGWLKSQDQFLSDLEGAALVTGAQFPPRGEPTGFPRPWPTSN